MATKFSQFTTGIAPVDATTFLVGYESVANTNNQYSKTDIVGWLSSGSGAISTLYTADGTITGNRTVTMGTNTLSFSSSSAPSVNTVFTFNGTYTSTIGAPGTGGGGFEIAGGYGTRLKPTYLQIYSGATIQGTSSGFLTIHSTVAANAGYSIDARLGVIGVHNDNTSYAFRVQNSDLTDIFSVNNDTTTTVEKNLVIKGQGYTELYDTANTTLTVNWNNSNIQELTGLTGPHTFTASNPKAGATYILTLAQTGAVTATWTGVSWPGGTAPTLSGNTKTDVVTLICYDATGAGLYYGSATLDLA